MHPNLNTLSDNVRRAIDNTVFWNHLKKLTDYLLPFVSTLDHLQRDVWDENTFTQSMLKGKFELIYIVRVKHILYNFISLH